jgi:hypothetical protein
MENEIESFVLILMRLHLENVNKIVEILYKKFKIIS